jgi:phosphoglycolate phosphatase-like HAD superfamily hydrolase
MGMFRDSSNQEIDIVKEMAEGLGNTGVKLEEIIEKAEQAQDRAHELLRTYRDATVPLERPSKKDVNASIREYNAWVDKAEDALRWLLIQREACGFRTHRNVDVFYPIPARMRLLDS